MPPDLWESAELQAAFADWHIGKVIRAYRHYPSHGRRPLPQDVVAGWLGLTQTQISRIESGHAITDLDKLVAWATTLAIPSQYLWFQLPDDRPAPMTASSSGYATSGSTSLVIRETVETTGRIPAEEGDDTRRKDFLVFAGTSLASLVAPPLIHGWRDQPKGPPAELDDILVAQLRAQTEGFRWLDRQHGSAELLPATARHAHKLADLWRSTDDRHGLRGQIGEIAANTCQLVGYQANDQGQRALAGDWYRASATLAAQAGAQNLYVLAMWEVAYLHFRNGERELGMSILHQLQDLPLSSAARCYVELCAAHGHASGGQRDANRRDAALRSLERAHAFAAQTANEPPCPVTGHPNSAHVEHSRALILAQLGDPDALPALREAEGRLPAVYEVARIRLTSSFALTYAHLGEVDQAAAHLATAVQRNRQIHSAEQTSRILEARRVLEPYRDSRAVQTVDQLLQDNKARSLNTGLG